MKKTISRLVLGLLLISLLPACASLPFELPWLRTTPTTTLAPGQIEEMTPTPQMTLTQESTPEPITSLTLWVPPEMDLEADTAASQVFDTRLQLFSDLHENIEINVRVKAAAGDGGLLDALTAAHAAAPGALPDLIALTRPDLEIAALKNLITPLDSLTQIQDDSDWYGFTQEMALLQGSTFGLPFAADSLVMVYRTGSFEQTPVSWANIFESDLILAFPAESEQSLFQMSLYQAAGGVLQDNQRRPMLEVGPLTETFRIFQQGLTGENLTENLLNYQTDAQVWTAFNEGQADIVITWLSNYLESSPEGTVVTPLLPVENSVSLGTGMSWTLASSDQNRHELAVELAEFLVDPEFLTEWTAASGYLPTRPSALESWQDKTLQPLLSQIALTTRLRPSNDIISSLGPIIREQTRQVLQGLVDPSQAAQVAVESLEE